MSFCFPVTILTKQTPRLFLLSFQSLMATTCFLFPKLIHVPFSLTEDCGFSSDEDEVSEWTPMQQRAS